MRVAIPLVLVALALLGIVAASAAVSVPEEPGWTPLFDGKSLTGWRTLTGKAIAGWVAEDGVLHYAPPRGGSGNDIYTEKEYANFVLELEWRIVPDGNSGIKYRMKFYDKEYAGPEYQILGPKAEGDPRGPSKGITGALYDILPLDPKSRELKPEGEWNHARIVADRKRLEHWLNGKKLLEADLASDAFKKAIADSKFRKWPDYAQNPSGRIMLQDHGGEVWFRNVRIRELP
jgi:hypothetical protein